MRCNMGPVLSRPFQDGGIYIELVGMGWVGKNTAAPNQNQTVDLLDKRTKTPAQEHRDPDRHTKRFSTTAPDPRLSVTTRGPG